jgi:hypothetical protein
MSIPFPSVEGTSVFPLDILGDVVNMNPGNVGFELLVHTIQNSTDFGRDQCWNILQELPLTLSSLDLWTRLLRNQTVPQSIRRTSEANGTQSPEPTSSQQTIAHLVSRAALGGFLEHCVTMIQAKEIEEREFDDGRNADLDPTGSCSLMIQNVSLVSTNRQD